MRTVDLSDEVVREFVAEVERLDAAGGQPADDLEKRLRRSAG